MIIFLVLLGYFFMGCFTVAMDKFITGAMEVKDNTDPRAVLIVWPMYWVVTLFFYAAMGFVILCTWSSDEDSPTR